MRPYRRRPRRQAHAVASYLQAWSAQWTMPKGNTIDGVPWGLLDYETILKDVVHAALDRVKKEVLDSLATASTTRRITVEAVADT